MKASSQDLVTEVDVRCQKLIEDSIKAAFPSHAMLGEESVEAGAAASAAAIERLERSPYLWVVDPIDGTTNFLHGIPFSSVSIGIAQQGRVMVGVVYEPYRDEMFSAIRGRGAHVNGVQMAVSRDPLMRNALFAYGLHHTKAVAHTMLRGVQAVGDVARGARSLGSAAVHLAYVAAGRFTGFWELDLSSWDLAAGSLLVEEAGGRVTDCRAVPYSLLTRDVMATNGAPEVHDGAIAALLAVGAHRKE